MLTWVIKLSKVWPKSNHIEFCHKSYHRFTTKQSLPWLQLKQRRTTSRVNNCHSSLALFCSPPHPSENVNATASKQQCAAPMNHRLHRKTGKTYDRLIVVVKSIQLCWTTAYSKLVMTCRRQQSRNLIGSTTHKFKHREPPPCLALSKRGNRYLKSNRQSGRPTVTFPCKMPKLRKWSVRITGKDCRNSFSTIRRSRRSSQTLITTWSIPSDSSGWWGAVRTTKEFHLF